MNDASVKCPKCGLEIRLSESLAAPLIESTKRQFEAQLAQKDAEIARREAAVREQQSAVDKAKDSVDAQVAEKLTGERRRIAEDEAKKAQRALALDLEQKGKEIIDLQRVLSDKDAKLAEAQAAQAETVRKQRELDDAKREIDLTVEKRVEESLAPIRIKEKREAEETLNLKVREKEETISSMQRQIEALKQKAEQGSQQLQGEAQELQLEDLLEAAFPHDTIQPVPKGEHGGDVVQQVNGPVGQPCGKILWESKRTKNWSDGWLPKLRDDQRAAGAEVALIISQALPKGIDSFDLVENIWVTAPRFAVPLATILRQSLIEIAKTRKTQDGQQTKMALVYQYLASPRFRHRIEAIVEKFAEMQSDLDRERKTMTRLWAKREEQIRGVVETTAGMYGDLQGIAGRTLQEIEGLALPVPEPRADSGESNAKPHALAASTSKDRSVSR